MREDAHTIAEAKDAYMPSWNTDKQYDAQSPSGIRGFFSKLLLPNRPLTKSDLEPLLKQIQQLLTSKNGAPSTATATCEVVERQLLDKK